MSPDEPTISTKRETRSSKRRPTNKQPESTHEADVSESESCCSVTSDVQPTSRSTRRVPVRAKPTTVDEPESSKAESSSLSLGKTPRRSTRGQNKPVPVLESTTSQEDEHSEAESCSSVVSLSRRVTRSHVKRTVAPADAAHSEADSCSSVVSGPQGSTVRRSTRSRVKVTEPIPIHLEQSETAEASAALEPMRTKGQRGKAKPAEKDQAYDSDGYQSGPSLSPIRITRSRVADSDSESVSTAHTSLDSPCSPQGRGTPCSSRTGSASSNHALRVSRSKSVRSTSNVHSMSSLVPKSVKKDREENEPKKDQGDTTDDVSFVPKSGTTTFDVEDVEEEDEEDANNKTVIAADQECSVSEDNNVNLTLTLDETETQEGKSERRRDISSETEKDVKESPEVADEPMETHGAGSIEELEAIEKESSCVSVMPQESCPGTDQSKLAKEPDTGIQERINTEGPSSSSEVTKTSIERTKPVKECVSLLDSSEDEGSDDDDDVLSVDGGNDEAGDSEDEMWCSGDQPGPSGAPDSLTGDGLFVIDARPGYRLSQKYYIDTTKKEIDDSKAAEEEEDFVDEEGEDEEDEEDEDAKVLFTTRKPALTDLSSSIDPGLKVKALGGLYINFDGSKSRSVSDTLKKLKEQKNQDELLKKSVIVADFEKKDTVPPYKESKHAAKLKRKEERAKTTGDGWFNMRAPELTQELKNDLKALQMRSAMDPKRFYKKNDREALPKYFQVGTVVDNPIDFYHSRIPKKDRKRTMVEELLADAEFR
ncbi:deoxynucleotidyltransferase terminal-interacting protein 2, partial [Clarias magur]